MDPIEAEPEKHPNHPELKLALVSLDVLSSKAGLLLYQFDAENSSSKCQIVFVLDP